MREYEYVNTLRNFRIVCIFENYFIKAIEHFFEFTWLHLNSLRSWKNSQKFFKPLICASGLNNYTVSQILPATYVFNTEKGAHRQI